MVCALEAAEFAGGFAVSLGAMQALNRAMLAAAIDISAETGGAATPLAIAGAVYGEIAGALGALTLQSTLEIRLINCLEAAGRTADANRLREHNNAREHEIQRLQGMQHALNAAHGH
jgi:hypothetical protein